MIDNKTKIIDMPTITQQHILITDLASSSIHLRRSTIDNK